MLGPRLSLFDEDPTPCVKSIDYGVPSLNCCQPVGVLTMNFYDAKAGDPAGTLGRVEKAKLIDSQILDSPQPAPFDHGSDEGPNILSRYMDVKPEISLFLKHRFLFRYIRLGGLLLRRCVLVN